MADGINAMKPADNGLTAITTAVETMKPTVTEARQDASWKASSYSIALAKPGTSILRFS